MIPPFILEKIPFLMSGIVYVTPAQKPGYL